ncbi:AAA domain-containing protein [Nonomuraea angiospora]
MSGSRQMPFPVDALLRAVRLEISAELRSDGNGEKVSLSSGRRTGRNGEMFEYLFACRGWKDAYGAEKLLIRLSQARRSPWASAEATRMHDGNIRVRTTADLGVQPANAQLRLDDSASLEAMAERLESAGGRDGVINLTTADWLYGRGTPRIGRSATPERFIRGYRERHLNLRQREAIEKALGSDLTFIWGPPGTGKTDVVSCIAEGCYRQGTRVLFLAPTKVAVDQALERICELLSGEEGFGDGLVQRAGEIESPSLAAKFGDQIDPHQIAARLSITLTTQITDVRQRLAAARGDLALHAEAVKTEEDLRTSCAQRDHAGGEANTIKRTAQAHRDAVKAIEQQVRDLGTPSGLFAKKKQAKLNDLGRTRWEHHAELMTLDQRLSTATAAWRRHSSEVAALEPKLWALRDRLRGVPAQAAIQEAAERLQQQLNALEQELSKINDVVRRNCRVMGTTVAKAVQSRRLLDSIDVVIIDEAGMVNTPSAWCAAGLATKRLVLAGDFRQLPAVTKASSDRQASEDDKTHARLWMDRDPFATAGLVDAAGSVRYADPRMVCLDTQYRMRPAICDIVNAVAYPDAPLRVGRDDVSRLHASPLLDGALILVDTTPRRLPNPQGRRNGHKTNPVHEAVIHELIRGLQYDEVLPARKWTDQRPMDRMAVIAPYRDQVRALRDSLKYRFGADYDGLVDTVHRFQGSQRRLVVIDTVAGAGTQLGYFYEQVGLASNTCRLLNVALSRAQDHLIVVADTQFLHGELPPGSEADRMLAHLERHAHRLSVDDLVPFRSAADLAGLPEEELARPAFFPADEVPRAVAWDLARAQRAIDIYCAFLDPVPVRRWLGHLAPRIGAGVRVTVNTRDQARPDLVRELESAGCQVVRRERMHEKVLIIDETILWHGSLNLLANVGPTDLMMRITDPTSCLRVRHIVDHARMERPLRTWPPTPANGVPVEPGTVVNGRLYIDTPRAEKDELKKIARAAGKRAIWDRERQLWHVDADIPPELIGRWLPSQGT